MNDQVNWERDARLDRLISTFPSVTPVSRDNSPQEKLEDLKAELDEEKRLLFEDRKRRAENQYEPDMGELTKMIWSMPVDGHGDVELMATLVDSVIRGKSNV